jgi:hypothetical protein
MICNIGIAICYVKLRARETGRVEIVHESAEPHLPTALRSAASPVNGRGKSRRKKNSREPSFLLDSLGGGLDLVHPEYESWRIGVGDALAANFLGENGQAIERNGQWLRA